MRDFTGSFFMLKRPSPEQTLMSARTSGCAPTAAASTQKAPSSASATLDSSARRKAATAKAQIAQPKRNYRKLGFPA